MPPLPAPSFSPGSGSLKVPTVPSVSGAPATRVVVTPQGGVQLPTRPLVLQPAPPPAQAHVLSNGQAKPPQIVTLSAAPRPQQQAQQFVRLKAYPGQQGGKKEVLVPVSAAGVRSDEGGSRNERHWVHFSSEASFESQI